MDYFQERFIEENFIEPIIGLNPRPEFINNLYSNIQMKKDYQWVVANLELLNSYNYKEGQT
jgi:hypothetical protein|tara:strand:- start:474 stop:656 length:183 start_codon:yes stop_codon:yes gene_type:complete